MNAPQNRIAMSVEETATALGIGKTILYEIMRRPDFPAIKCGRRTIIPVSELERWLAAQPHIGEASN